MTTFDERTATQFDHHSTEYAENSRSINAELRAKCPVAHTDAHGGFWVISRYEDVVAAAKNDAAFASGHTVNGVSPLGVAIPSAPLPMYPIEMDPPDYLPYRKLLNPFFSPQASKAWQEPVAKWVDVCLDQVIESGRFDIVGDLANPVPSLFTCEFLGLPIEDWRAYAEVQHEIIYTPRRNRPARTSGASRPRLTMVYPVDRPSTLSPGDHGVTRGRRSAMVVSCRRLATATSRSRSTSANPCATARPTSHLGLGPCMVMRGSSVPRRWRTSAKVIESADWISIHPPLAPDVDVTTPADRSGVNTRRTYSGVALTLSASSGEPTGAISRATAR